LDAGDLLLPTLPASLSAQRRSELVLKADLIIKAFNQMGCDAVAVGDADLGLGKDLLLKMAGAANFPFISSNILDRETGSPMVKPFAIREMNGLRIGIIALISRDAFDDSEGQPLRELDIQDPYMTAERIVRQLRDQTDLIVLLSHLGYQGDQALAKKVNGIDIIVGGHTAVPLYNPPVVNETLILQNSAYGRNIGSIEIEFSKERASFSNVEMMKSLKDILVSLDKKIRTLEAQKPGKQRDDALKSTVQYKEIVEKKLQTHGNGKPFCNRIIPLREGIRSDPDVLTLIDAYKENLANLAQEGTREGCGSGPGT
jgi:2',3'-cyclic-nucleotide 2'-phosphodiesterase (5'-nucleotidase family)